MATEFTFTSPARDIRAGWHLQVATHGQPWVKVTGVSERADLSSVRHGQTRNRLRLDLADGSSVSVSPAEDIHCKASWTQLTDASTCETCRTGCDCAKGAESTGCGHLGCWGPDATGDCPEASRIRTICKR